MCPGDESSPFVGPVELIILFPLANQVADGVRPGPKPAPARAQELTRQLPAPEQRLEGDDALASLGPLQLCAGMDVEFAGDVRVNTEFARGSGFCYCCQDDGGPCD